MAALHDNEPVIQSRTGVREGPEEDRKRSQANWNRLPRPVKRHSMTGFSGSSGETRTQGRRHPCGAQWHSLKDGKEFG